jgi:hypothetical protein
MLQEAIISVEVAQLAKQLGYINGSSTSYIMYNSTYIYDGSPEHPESYKKGEVRFHSRNYQMNNIDSVAYYDGIDLDDPDTEYYELNKDLVKGDILWKLFEAPTQALLYKWLRENYNIHIKIDKIKDGYYGNIHIGDKEYVGYVFKNSSIVHSFIDYDKYEICFENCLYKVIKYLLNENKSGS